MKTGLGIKDQDRNVIANQTLILRFFASASEYLTSGDVDYNFKKKKGEESEDEGEDKTREGVVMITLKESKPYNLWNVTGLAKNPPIELPELPGQPSTAKGKKEKKGCAYKVLRSSPFNWEFYPTYSHRKTSASMKNVVNSSQSRIYEFVRIVDKNNQPRNKK